MNEAIKPYLARSAGAHAAVVAAFIFLVPHGAKKLDKVYMIDFVGGPTTIASAGPSVKEIARAAAAAPAAVAAQTDPHAIATKGHRRGPIALPRPSLLAGGGKQNDTGASASASSSLAGPGAPAATATSASAGAGSGPGSSSQGVTMDMPDFPYPWYISQVRQHLWDAWQRRMPRLDAEGAIGFSILPNGSFTDLSVESSSGDADFDKAALESVQAAAPFPALPVEFHEKFLKIHLTLKSEEAWR